MTRRPPPLLVLAVLGLAGLVLADAVRGPSAPAEPSSHPAIQPPGRASAGARPPAMTPGAASRAAVRERLLTFGPGTYFDSLLSISDSVIRRWDDAHDVIHFAFVHDEPEGWHPALADEVRLVLRQWSPAPIRFEEAPDTAAADVVFSWVPQFGIRRAGQTDLFWDGYGTLYRARVTLALRSELGQPLPRAARMAVAMHEVGHVLGLPHSADSVDVMYEATRVESPSPRDRRTLRLLYDLPVGLVREPRERR
jgi:hypothetical protein